MNYKTKQISFFLAFILSLNIFATAQSSKADICIYGATSAGVIAAYTAAKMNKKVILIEAGRHLGGLTTGGLGYTDIGNKYAITGISLDFYRRIGKHYGKLEQWIFEPHVAKDILQEYLDDAKVQVLYDQPLISIEKNNGKLTSASFGVSSDKIMKVEAAVFIDCSYEGDLMARAGVSYTVGREANDLYKETYNGVQLLNKHQFPDGIDPYKTPGDPNSGLVWGVSAAKLDPQGTGDKKVQAYNFRICLSNQPANRIPITQPDNYDPAKYELLLRYLAKKVPGDLWGFLKFDLMPNGKTDINNNGPISTDMIGMNYDFAEADYATRKKIQKEHEDYTKGLLYFIGHDDRMPIHLREKMLEWGYPKDEYTEFNNWSPQMYVREARRMLGDYVMTQSNCEGREVVADGVGMAAYTMDSHNCQRLVVNGMVKNEGDVQIGGFGPYPVAYRSITPKATECKNLLVPVCLSASHIAYGSIRMEPVFMALGQSAAVAAVLAIKAGSAVQQVDVKQINAILKKDPLANGSLPEIVIDNADGAQVETTGDWETRKNLGFGPSSLLSGKAGGKASVTFKPEIIQKGRYEIYVYCLPKFKGIDQRLSITVSDGSRETPVVIDLSTVDAKGQTSGEWVNAGIFDLPVGKKSFVRINGSEKSALVIADAVLFRPIK